jgi:D-tyrosyl-tRNA(Tyr) deacylase
MKAILQRVTSSKVTTQGKIIGEIGIGLNILLGVEDRDDESIIQKFTEKIVNLRVFADDEGKMNKSLLDVKGEVLLVSQFTLIADCKKGRRPSFMHAASAELGRDLYEKVVEAIHEFGIKVSTGEFGEYMVVDIQNDGPVTIILDSDSI